MQLARVKALLMPILTELHLKYYDVEWVREYGMKILRISIDKQGGIDTESLSMVNNRISELLDNEPGFDEAFMLEVCSPGAERPLRNLEEIQDHVGYYVLVEAKDATYEGTLEALNDGVLTLKINIKGRIKKVDVPYDTIIKARTAIKF